MVDSSSLKVFKERLDATECRGLFDIEVIGHGLGLISEGFPDPIDFVGAALSVAVRLWPVCAAGVVRWVSEPHVEILKI